MLYGSQAQIVNKPVFFSRCKLVLAGGEHASLRKCVSYWSVVTELTLAGHVSVLVLRLGFFLLVDLFRIYCFLLYLLQAASIIVVHANSFPQESWVRASAAQITNDNNSSAGPRLYIKC